MATAGLLALALVVSPGATATAAPRDQLAPVDQAELYRLTGTPGTARTLAGSGYDVVRADADGGRERIDLTLTPAELRRLRGLGHRPELVRNRDGQTQLQAARAQAAAGFTVWRSYSEPGGIADQLRAIAAANPGVTKLETVGHSLRGQPILALKVTAGARGVPDGRRPSVLYSSLQHAREWISGEVNMRLLEHVIAHQRDADMAALLAGTELWFLPVANPDGYDFTFIPENRMWRRTLRDNNGDGEITRLDGVDPNRNFPTNFHYDEEGSSSTISSDTYRGTAPASEPETRAMDGLMKRVRFTAQINYHSYGPLLLYPIGWQTSTKSADDPLYVALSGDDAKPAIAGFDPDLSAELYTTNGETTDHSHATYGTLAWTPELNEGCEGCGFVFPDDENLVQAEFAKNLPFALDVAKSARNPVEPVSHLGNTTPDFVVDTFTESRGRDQVVQVDAKRRLGPVLMRYRINDGRTVTVPTAEWRGGERYGAGYNTYYHMMRAKVRGAAPGDRVTVWFTAPAAGSGSQPFTYTVADDIGGEVLVLAAEDVTGASPVQGLTEARHAGAYTQALARAGHSSDVYDVDAAGRAAPHPLGVLSHYRAVVWETGDDIITRAQGQPAGTAANLAHELELSVRDYLNEGGKLLFMGKNAGLAHGTDSTYYYRPEAPAGAAECTTRTDPPCLPLINDFLQYYLGAFTYVDNGGSDDDGQPFPVTGGTGEFAGFTGTLNGGDSADNQDHTAVFLTTSSFLPAERFPNFAGSPAAGWQRPFSAPFDPRTGDWYAYSDQADISYKRLTRTVDLTGRSSAELRFMTSYDTEEHWDHLFVEAHTVGQDDWTTLPEANGHTTQETGDSCASGWRDIHPFTTHYQGSDCSPTGTTGEWHAASGRSNGWQQWSVDLSAYAGSQVEVSISYVSDWATQGIGVFVDDVELLADSAPVATTSFEGDLGGWTVAGPADGSDAAANDWRRTQKAFEEGAGVATEDTVYFGFGLEGLSTQQMRTDLIARAMRHLLQ